MQVTDPKPGQVLYAATACTERVEAVRTLEDLNKILCVNQYVAVALSAGRVGAVSTAHDPKTTYFGYTHIVGSIGSLPELWDTPEEAIASAVERLIKQNSAELHDLDCQLQVLWVWKEQHQAQPAD